MKKLLLSTTCFLLILLFTKEATGQRGYSTIHLAATKHPPLNEYKLYFNDKLVTTSKAFEAVEYKIYSGGRIAVTLLYNNRERVEGVIDVGEKKDYYLLAILMPGAKANSVDEKRWKEFSSKITNTVRLEENIEQPVGKLDDPATQGGFAKIHIMSKGFPTRIYMNDELVTGLNKDEVLDYKIRSRGRVTITGVVSYGHAEGVVDVKDGSDMYIIISGIQFVVVDIVRWEKEMKNFSNTVALEESISAPVVKNAKGFGSGQGTCFIISADGYLITNYHCVENAKEVTVKGIDGDFTTKYGATLVASDPSNDLALLKIGNKNVKFDAPVFGLRCTGVNQAEKVYALGFPAAVAMGQEVKITEGIISAKSGAQGDISKYQISAAVNHGNSGGPLIDEQGNLIGVIFAKSTIAESAGYAIKASYLETFLKNVEGFELPVYVNSIQDKPLTEKVAAWKGNIFIVESN